MNLLLLVSCFICMWKAWKNPRFIWPFTTQKGTLLRRFEKLSPLKKLIFSCKAHTAPNHKLDKGIMEETSCLRTAVIFHSHCSPLVQVTQQVVTISLVMVARPMPQLVQGTGQMLSKCFASVQCPKPSKSPTATSGRWQKTVSSLTQVCLSCKCILTRTEEEQWHQLPQIWIVIVPVCRCL